MLKVLDSSLVSFSLLARGESSQISSLPVFRILLARVETILPRFQFSDHTLSAQFLEYSQATFRVRLAFIADSWRAVGPRRFAADLACFESAGREAAE